MSSTSLQCFHGHLGGRCTTPSSSKPQPHRLERHHSPPVNVGGGGVLALRSLRDGSADLTRRTSGCGDGLAVLRSRSRSAGRFGGGRVSVVVTASAADPPPSAPDVAPSPLPVAPSFTEAENSNAAAAEVPSDEGPSPLEAPKSLWQNWRAKSAAMREKLSKWGLAAVLAYGLFDGVTYTTFFVLAFLSYEKTTGQNPVANLKSLLGVVVLMWGGNNVTRPFRIAGAAALAPFIDTGLKKLQKALRLPNQLFAFMLCVGTFACACFAVVGVLILSRSAAIV